MSGRLFGPQKSGRIKGVVVWRGSTVHEIRFAAWLSPIISEKQLFGLFLFFYPRAVLEIFLPPFVVFLSLKGLLSTYLRKFSTSCSNPHSSQSSSFWTSISRTGPSLSISVYTMLWVDASFFIVLRVRTTLESLLSKWSRSCECWIWPEVPPSLLLARCGLWYLSHKVCSKIRFASPYPSSVCDSPRMSSFGLPLLVPEGNWTYLFLKSRHHPLRP